MDIAESQVVVDRVADSDGALVIDVSNLAHRSAHAYNLTTSDGRPSGHVYGSVHLLLATLRNHVGSGRWCPIMCYDGCNSKAPRLEIYPEYKSGRTPPPYPPVPDAARVLRMCPGLHVEAPDREGDDAIAWIADTVYNTRRCKTIILTSDKDLWSLLKYETVHIFSPSKDRFITHDDIEKEYLVRDPNKVYLSKALFGDSSDNIRGIQRLTKKVVAPYLNLDEVVCPDTFYAALERHSWKDLTSGKPMTPKMQAKLQDGKEKVLLNFRVVRPLVSGFGSQNIQKVSGGLQKSVDMEAALLRFECRSLATKLAPLFGAPQFVKEPK